jgi:hypothetical protein
MVVYHDKWLSKFEMENQSRIYICGGLAAYGFYFFQGVSECKPIFLDHLRFGISRIQGFSKDIFINPNQIINLLIYILQDAFYIFKGIFLAIIFAKFVPIPSRENVVKRYYRKQDLYS